MTYRFRDNCAQMDFGEAKKFCFCLPHLAALEMETYMGECDCCAKFHIDRLLCC